MQTEEYEGKAEATKEHATGDILEGKQGTNLLRLGSRLGRQAEQVVQSEEVGLPDEVDLPEQVLQPEDGPQPDGSPQPEDAVHLHEVHQPEHRQQQEITHHLPTPSESATDAGYTGHIKQEVAEPTRSPSPPERSQGVIDLVSSPEPEIAERSVKLEADVAQEPKQDPINDSRKRGRSITFAEDSSSDDEDIEVELRKTKLQLRELELEQKLLRKRRKA